MTDASGLEPTTAKRRYLTWSLRFFLSVWFIASLGNNYSQQQLLRPLMVGYASKKWLFLFYPKGIDHGPASFTSKHPSKYLYVGWYPIAMVDDWGWVETLSNRDTSYVEHTAIPGGSADTRHHKWLSSTVAWWHPNNFAYLGVSEASGWVP